MISSNSGLKLNKLIRIIALSIGVAVFTATPVFATGKRQMFEGNASMTVNDFMSLSEKETTVGNSSDTIIKYGITGEVVIEKKKDDPVPKPLDAEQSSSSGSVAKNQTVTTVFLNNKPAVNTSNTVRTDPEDVMTKQQEEEVLDTVSIQNYISADYSVLQQFTNESEYTTRARQSLISFAMQFVGNPYVWGGTSLTNGCDCSGFVQEVFRHFGIITGRTSRDQYANCVYLKGKEVMPGDLIFYADETGYINHVAIYAGNYMIVHAANRKAGIKVNRYDYKRPYAYGRFIAN